MEFRHSLGFNVAWNEKTVSLLLFLLVVPNVLGAVNLPTVFGFKLHLFQVAIFLAALIYGPLGGGLAGLTGSS